LERGLDALEDEVMRRAKDGVVEPVFYKGRVVGEKRRYSDNLAMFILKSRRRGIWGEHREVDVKNDYELMSEEQRLRKAHELVEIMRYLSEPPPKPRPLVYRPEEEPDERDEK
jgi:hypothetical protein